MQQIYGGPDGDFIYCCPYQHAWCKDGILFYSGAHDEILAIGHGNLVVFHGRDFGLMDMDDGQFIKAYDRGPGTDQIITGS